MDLRGFQGHCLLLNLQGLRGTDSPGMEYMHRHDEQPFVDNVVMFEEHVTDMPTEILITARKITLSHNMETDEGWKRYIPDVRHT
jgi:hypothetical protein